MTTLRVSSRRAVALTLSLGVAACSSLTDAPPVGPAGDAGTQPPATGDAGHGANDGGGGAVATDGGDVTSDDGSPPSNDGQPPTDPKTRVVGYVPNYNGSYAEWIAKIDLSKITHLNLAFADPPKCGSGTCTANDDMTFGTGDDQDIGALVTAAHAAGIKVLVSIGGGGGDRQIAQFYNAGLSTPLIASLDKFVTANDLDGVDLDIESPGQMGTPYVTFVDGLVSMFRPKGKLVTAAVAKWVEDSMSSAERGQFDTALPKFDFVNVMVYANLADATEGLQYFSQKGLPNAQITLGVPFFGSATDGSGNETDEPEYAAILKAYPDAWQTDSVSGGAFENGETVTYVGEATMAKEVQLGKQYGGIMIWELTGDAPAPHSLMSVIGQNL